ncbi:hypothetical protein HYFRA_00002124 [Hymenoscyphus fraxineus]|uniref:Uncharacterized protein n=1 Tax=Hymenoscyphus fraxineus TaxID=746836 RepID=A0A9N9PJS8_9HELO|nr:hypothetical protein HYFRA_00002124 [Hymenoscyphus fraxineus]
MKLQILSVFVALLATAAATPVPETQEEADECHSAAQDVTKRGSKTVQRKWGNGAITYAT